MQSSSKELFSLERKESQLHKLLEDKRSQLEKETQTLRGRNTLLETNFNRLKKLTHKSTQFYWNLMNNDPHMIPWYPFE